MLVEMKWVSVSAHSAGAYTATLYVMVTIVKWGGCASPTLTSLGKFLHHDGIYARARPFQLCVYSVGVPLALFLRKALNLYILCLIF